jgi:hypothetical protein
MNAKKNATRVTKKNLDNVRTNDAMTNVFSRLLLYNIVAEFLL